MAAKKLTKTQIRTLEETLREERAGLVAQAEDLRAEAGVDRWRGDGSGDDIADRGTASAERETAATLSDHASRLVDEIDEALRRLDAGTYGVCVRCGQNIGFDRLEAVPAAALCLECKRRDESGR